MRAAAALGVAPHTIRDYIRSGKLTGRLEGVQCTWYVSVDSIHAPRDARAAKRTQRRAANPWQSAAILRMSPQR